MIKKLTLKAGIKKVMGIIESAKESHDTEANPQIVIADEKVNIALASLEKVK